MFELDWEESSAKAACREVSSELALRAVSCALSANCWDTIAQGDCKLTTFTEGSDSRARLGRADLLLQSPSSSMAESSSRGRYRARCEQGKSAVVGIVRNPLLSLALGDAREGSRSH